MKIFGLQIPGTKAVQSINASGQLAGVDNRGWFRILESFAGAWQRNVEITLDNVTTHPAVFACTTLIANDIAKMLLRLVQKNADSIWQVIDNPSFSPVLRRPNHYQNRIQFILNWVTSKLLHGNTYVIKVRDNRGGEGRGVVTAMYILDPQRVRPLVSPSGEVFYELKRDDISQLPQEQYIVPASEIIHDRHNCLFHPLVGLSSIYACGLAAVQGLNIQNSSTTFFGNGANPGGVITVPGAIDPAAAVRVKEAWDTGFSGDNSGKVAILTDGMTYQQMKVSAVDSQLIDQLKWTDEIVCATFHVPPYMVGFGPPPNFNNIEALNQQYYSQCLQILVESIELCLDEGLGLTTGDVAAQKYGTEFDIDDLLRMDSATMMNTLEKGKNYLKPNEGRKKLNLPPVAGGDTVYRQQQEFSLEALNKRDTQADPFSMGKAPAAAAPPPSAGAEDPDEMPDAEAEKAFVAMIRKELEMVSA